MTEPHDPSPQPLTPGDAFEAQAMHDGARVVHRDKRVSRAMAAVMALPAPLAWALAVFIAVSNASSSKPLSATALPFVVAAIALLGVGFLGLSVVFSVVRTVVTAAAVHVKFGLWGPKIPLERLRSCRAIDYPWREFGGWGIRRGRDGTWAYVPTGGRVLELRYEDGGVEKRVLVGVDDPDETVRQIEAARRVRVAVDPAEAAQDEGAAVLADRSSDARVGRGRAT